jgi:hypothetical protein
VCKSIETIKINEISKDFDDRWIRFKNFLSSLVLEGEINYTQPEILMRT